MNEINRTARLSMIGMLFMFGVASCLLMVDRAPGSRAAFAAPTVVVSIDYPTVLEKLKQRAEAETELQRVGEQMLAEEKQRQDAITAKRDELEDVPTANAMERQRIVEEMALMALELNAWRAYVTEQIDIDKSVMLRDLDRTITRAISDMAAVNGYDIVLSSDAAMQLAINPGANVSREIQVQQQMRSRRVLFAGNIVDVTDDLIARMNNAFKGP